MSEIFQHTVRPASGLFLVTNDKNDPRLGQVVGLNEEDYRASEIVILGCPQDEGVRRNRGRVGAADAPDAIRRQFYRLTPFNIRRRLFDLGNIDVSGSLEEIHQRQTAVVTQILKDGKRLIVLGGGNDISYADGSGMAAAFGPDHWIGVNIDAHFDVRIAGLRNSGTPYRQLLEEKLLLPSNFYEVGYQAQASSPAYYDYIRRIGVNRISLDQLQSRGMTDTELKESLQHKLVEHRSSLKMFFGFDIDAIRMADAPAVSAPSPLGLKADEFIRLVNYAASLANTKIVEFTELNPKFDIDDQTAKLVAIAMHKFCSAVE